MSPITNNFFSNAMSTKKTMSTKKNMSIMDDIPTTDDMTNEMKDKITCTNWAALKTYLQNKDVSYSQLQLECGICYQVMDMPADMDQRDEDHERRHTEDEETPTIQACGHIYCNACLEECYGPNSDIEGGNCFKCRTELVHRGCGHLNCGQKFPSTKKRIDSFTPLLSEGGQLTDRCNLCILGDYCSELKKVAQSYNSILNDPSREMGISVHDQFTGKAFYINHDVDEWDAMRCDTPEEAKPILERFKKQRNAINKSSNLWSGMSFEVGISFQWYIKKQDNLQYKIFAEDDAFTPHRAAYKGLRGFLSEDMPAGNTYDDAFTSHRATFKGLRASLFEDTPGGITV
ncbi:hypothetical protein LB507_007968 [Fusarium sp. FIESC RH6]|nr:hypothetical protein LB507_007968 [Fusarium sp. FIESC RH6]